MDAVLLTNIDESRIAGAGLDVTVEEPLPRSSPLFGAPNCLITPHIAWATVEARERLLQEVVRNIKGFLAGNPCNVVNP